MLKTIKSKVSKFRDKIVRPVEVANPVDATVQVMLKNQYKLMNHMGPECLPHINDTGFSVYSQFEEDGILLYIFSLIGEKTKRVVEICAGDGRECMATNLIINHGWDGLLFDGNEESVKAGQDFFSKNKATYLKPPRFCHAWITRENINELIRANDFSGEVDLLSLDIDGNDYWILKAIDVITPRVIICETHSIIPSELALTIPYTPEFHRLDLPRNHQDFMGVSLLAMKELCESKGYRLIGAHQYGFNAIFMKNGEGEQRFPEISIEAVHNNPFTIAEKNRRWPAVKDLKWEKV